MVAKSTFMARTATGLLSVAIFASVPSSPANAVESCYEAAVFCKYHQNLYSSWAECFEEESKLYCPSSTSRMSSPDLLGKMDE